MLIITLKIRFLSTYLDIIELIEEIINKNEL